MRMLPPLLDHRLRAAITLMRDNVGSGIGVEEVAEKVGLSRAHFFVLFKDQLNTTPQVFWSALRVEEAMRRLIVPNATLPMSPLISGFQRPAISRASLRSISVSPHPLLDAQRSANPGRHKSWHSGGGADKNLDYLEVVHVFLRRSNSSRQAVH